MSALLTQARRIAERFREQRQGRLAQELGVALPGVLVTSAGADIVIEGRAVLRRCRLEPDVRALTGASS